MFILVVVDPSSVSGDEVKPKKAISPGEEMEALKFFLIFFSFS